MYKRIIDFLNKRQLIYGKQFGFRSHYSTDHAVLSIILICAILNAYKEIINNNEKLLSSECSTFESTNF